MSYNDWDPEDLLEFKFDKPRPEEIPQQKPSLAPLRQDQPDAQDVARREAQEAAYLRYRQEFVEKDNKKSDKKSKKQEKRELREQKRAAKVKNTSKLYKFSKIITIPYVILFAIFTVVMTIMDVLPFFLMVSLYVVLGLLSLIIIIQLSKNNVKKWAKIFATIMACLLMFFYGLGTAYALGTLSFLDTTSVDNANSVDKITKEPFNVLITGMDVWGKIDEQGRSDVNMVVTVNPNTETILMTSIPRDYEVRLPDMDYATDKLTHSGFYSVDTTIHAVEDLLQIQTNYYVKVNFTTICKFIDAIGGLDINNPIEFDSAIQDYHYDKGKIHVNGHAALYYARERKAFEGGDNDRVKNQQLIFSEMLKKATSSGTMLLSYSKVLSNLKDYFVMSFSSKELRSLVKMQIGRNIKWKMYKNTLTGAGATKPTYSTGSQAVYVTAQDATSIANAQELIQAVFDGKRLAKDKNDVVYIKTGTEKKADK